MIDALEDANKKRGPPKSFHSDQGSEYDSSLCRAWLPAERILPAQSHKAHPWKNGHQESFFGRFKAELGNLYRFDSLEQLIEAIHHQIHYYNNARIYTALRMTPRQKYQQAVRQWQITEKTIRNTCSQVSRKQGGWRQEGLKVPQRRAFRRGLGCSGHSCTVLKAERANQLWTYDFMADQTDDGRPLRFLSVVDEYTRECLSFEVERSMGAAEVIAVLAGVVAGRQAPEHLRSDNGPEFVARAVREWLQERACGQPTSRPGVRGRMRTWRAATVVCATSS